MGLKDLWRSIKPTVEDESCDYLLSRIFATKVSKGKTYKFTNVTPGLATLIKRRFDGGNYFKDTGVVICNYKPNTNPIEISCKIQDLEALLIKIKKEE